ncbi:hypothetical protein HETIRDRAFT_453803 [Heterobasidion irregulare TC 32-1]|uniref:Uncharacterized protein n=1 Tax=Heterobasidion irregulare (strain TC 32-1) TaxID=747525 RepID=W4K0Q8_HETIT|nr:uncharacterized protein HETIRDRAFT_453803 [Heterobasidion irregulare TC 32-1]ETW79377.1 hypothetical protein HETIRDRAFT_453803 [Heterobasidion irregulare TC 32-1]
MGYPPSPPQRGPAPPTPTRLHLHCSMTQASMTMRMRMRFGTGGDDHRRGKVQVTRTSTRGTSLALVSPLSRPTLSNRFPALLLSPLSLLSLLDVIPTGPLARSLASSAPPRALSAFPGSSLDTPASPTRRHSQSLTPLSYYGLEPLLRHASPRPPPRLRAHSALCMLTPSTFVCIPSAVNIPTLDVAHPRRLAPPVPSFLSNVNRPLDSIPSTRCPPPHLTNPLVLVASTISVRTLGTLQACYLEPLNSAPSMCPLLRAERQGRYIDAFARALAQDAPSLRPFEHEQRGRDSPGGREKGWIRTMDGGGGQTWVGMDDDDLGTSSLALSLPLSRQSFPLAQATPALILPFSLHSTSQPLTINLLISIPSHPLTCSSRSPSTFDTKTPDI